MRVLLILALAAAVEIAVLIVVGGAIGVLPTIGLLVLASVLGGVVLRREGSRTLAALSEAARTRRPPHRELADGVIIAASGVLIVVPGFVSDALGLLCLLPPTRALLRRRLVRLAGGPRSVRFGNENVVDGEVVDEDRPRPASFGTFPGDPARRTGRPGDAR